jgi:hypothetical protein
MLRFSNDDKATLMNLLRDVSTTGDMSNLSLLLTDIRPLSNALSCIAHRHNPFSGSVRVF